MRWPERGNEEENGGGQAKLDEHMQRGGEEREVEVEMFAIEHPFVVLSIGISRFLDSFRRNDGRTYNGDGKGEEVPQQNQYGVDQQLLDHISVCQSRFVL